jgi:isocitrate/isopropylmalate dehydrogenase
MSMRTHHIAAIGGDGIGPEVIAAGLQALEVCAERDGGFKFEVEHFDWGSDYYKKHGVMMPEDGADKLRKFDAVEQVRAMHRDGIGPSAIARELGISRMSVHRALKA